MIRYLFYQIQYNLKLVRFQKSIFLYIIFFEEFDDDPYHFCRIEYNLRCFDKESDDDSYRFYQTKYNLRFLRFQKSK